MNKLITVFFLATHLALHYLTLDGTKGPRGIPLEDLDPSTVPPADPNAPLKSIVLIGSVGNSVHIATSKPLLINTQPPSKVSRTPQITVQQNTVWSVSWVPYNSLAE